ncbi:MAG: alpha-L-fucosidase, partial [Anaerolineae bacterium]|nr:alpha-L-fucosidase [Anaerolineae bacterium]
RQLAWQRLEFYGFIHFGVNTFTNREWGTGAEDPGVFDPTDFDARQWVDVFKDAGMRGLILTAKHHDGFCLWPSAYTDHSVASSPWREGQGDLVAEVAAACREGGLKFGIYVSPWDRHEPSYGDSPRYNEHFRAQLRELLSGYGPLFSVWFDGACGEGPNGKRQVYDWDSAYALIRELQPDAAISICGPDVRWCGNEAGHCRPSEWSVVPASLKDREKIAERSQQEDDGTFARRVDTRDDDLGSRERLLGASAGAPVPLAWYPAEVNTSIRPGWFYHPEEDDKVRSLSELLDISQGAVGGNATLLLNVPPERRGLIHEADAARLSELGRALRATFDRDLAQGAVASAGNTRQPEGRYAAARVLDGQDDTFWMAPPGQESVWLELSLPEPRRFNVVMLQEAITHGQRIERVRVSVLPAGGAGAWRVVGETTTVGYKRLLRLPAVTAQRIRIEVLESRIAPTLSAVGLYCSWAGSFSE